MRKRQRYRHGICRGRRERVEGARCAHKGHCKCNGAARRASGQGYQRDDRRSGRNCDHNSRIGGGGGGLEQRRDRGARCCGAWLEQHRDGSDIATVRDRRLGRVERVR